MADLTQQRLLELLDYDPVTGDFRWRVDRGGGAPAAGAQAGGINGRGYVVIGIDQKSYQAHRLAWLYTHGVWPKDQIDHINRNRADNRLSNLREATNGQNQANSPRHANNRSGYKGVYWDKNNKYWVAQIRRKLIGTFHDAESASEAYNAAAAVQYGEFARVA